MCTNGEKANGLKMRTSGETVRMAHPTDVRTLRLLYIFFVVFVKGYWIVNAMYHVDEIIFVYLD